MTSPRDLVLLALLALALGVAIPLMVQVFLALRDARRTMARLEIRIEPALRDVEEVAALLRRRAQPLEVTSGIAEALVPAALAAVRAFRASMSSPEAGAAVGKDNAPPASVTKGSRDGRDDGRDDRREMTS